MRQAAHAPDGRRRPRGKSFGGVADAALLKEDEPSEYGTFERRFRSAELAEVVGSALLRVCTVLLALAIVVVIVCKVDLSFLDFSGYVIFRWKEDWYCATGTAPAAATPYFAQGYLQSDGTLVGVAICPPCSCQGAPSGHWRQTAVQRIGEGATGLAPQHDFSADVWVTRWQPTAAVGSALTWGSVPLPVLAAQSPGPAGAARVALCASIYTAVDPAWLGEWLDHHLAGIDGTLYLYSSEAQSSLGRRAGVEVIDTREMYEAAQEAWTRLHGTSRAAEAFNHLIQIFALQDCLYRARARGVGWLLQLDVDEYLDFGDHGGAAGLLHWASAAAVDAVTFASFPHDVHTCVASAGLAGAGRWRRRLPCTLALPECNDGWRDPLSELAPGLGDCLGPRGHRKYLVRPTAVNALSVHTPGVGLSDVLSELAVHHFGHEHGAPVIHHFQGAVRPGARLCAAPADVCDPAQCRAWRADAVCDAPPLAATGGT